MSDHGGRALWYYELLSLSNDKKLHLPIIDLNVVTYMTQDYYLPELIIDVRFGK